LVQIAQRFEHFLETYRRPDGSRWGGQDLHDATGGVVTRSYVTSLRKGRIENPGFEKLRAIAKAMGFPPELWFEEGVGDGSQMEPPRGGRDIAGRLEHLFGAVKNSRTSEPYTSADVARLSAGDLTEEDVEGIRERPDTRSARQSGGGTCGSLRRCALLLPGAGREAVASR
jgi:hypothetical protein